MSLLSKIKQFLSKIFNLSGPSVTIEAPNNKLSTRDLGKRLDRLERNYIILLKRVLEIDGVQLMTKTSAFSNKILATPNDEFNKGMNETEPTIH